MPHIPIWVSHTTMAKLRQLAIEQYGLPAELHVQRIAERAVENLVADKVPREETGDVDKARKEWSMS